MSRDSAPARGSFVAACGALGDFDRERVLAMTRAFAAPPRVVEDGPGAILALDREPGRWSRGGRRGFAWPEAPGSTSPRAPSSWRDVARAGMCGMVVERRGGHVHSSVSGTATLYFRPARDAVYFATRIDPLVAVAPGRLSVDWEAWASILTLRYPLGERTPFVEVRRLGPGSVLRCRRGRADVTTDWEWTDVQPRRDAGEAAPELAERLRAVVAELPAGPVLCQLSGGFDSRLLLAVLAERPDRSLSALTADMDGGRGAEQRAARAVAELLGVPHGTVAGDDVDYWRDLELLADRVEYQFVRGPWRVPMLPLMQRSGAIVVDGLGLDTFAAAGDRYLTPAVTDPAGGDATVRALWRAVKQDQIRRGGSALRQAAKPLWASAREQLLSLSEPLRGHPHRGLLTFYLTRQMRGIALSPWSLLGAVAPVAVPYVDDRFARAALAVTARSKAEAGLYRALFAAVHPRLGELPATRRGDVPAGARQPRRGQSAAAAEALHACLADGPLTPYLEPRALRVLSRHRRGKPARTYPALLPPAFFHMWARRYSDRLASVEPAAALGAPVRRG